MGRSRARAALGLILQEAQDAADPAVERSAALAPEDRDALHLGSSSVVGTHARGAVPNSSERSPNEDPARPPVASPHLPAPSGRDRLRAAWARPPRPNNAADLHSLKLPNNSPFLADTIRAPRMPLYG